MGRLYTRPVFAQQGPYEVGVTTLELDDRQVEVWYPTRPAAVRGAEHDAYFIRDFTSPAVQSLLPPEINPPFETQAYRDVDAANGRRFPIVLFSHGALSFRLQSTFLTTHLASWGFVVASPDFLERGLQTFLGQPPAVPKTSVQVLSETVALLKAEDLRPGGVLQELLDDDIVLPIGHSAGGGASSQFVVADPTIPAWSALAAGATGPTGPGSAGLWMAGENDQVAPIAGIRSAFDGAPGPKRLVVIPGAGHNNAFSDICEIGEGGGGVIALALQAGLPLPSPSSASVRTVVSTQISPRKRCGRSCATSSQRTSASRQGSRPSPGASTTASPNGSACRWSTCRSDWRRHSRSCLHAAWPSMHHGETF